MPARSRAAPCLRTAALLTMLLAAPACSPDDPPPDPPDAGGGCQLPFLGDPNGEPQIEILVLDSLSVSRPLGDGDTVDVILPPQGGRVIFAGVRATNVNPCAVDLKGVLRDPETSRVTVDRRTVNLRPADDGWGTSVDTDISTFANIAVCPNQWSSRDIIAQDYELEVELTDRKKTFTAKKAVMVRPACNEPDAEVECRCICKHGYVLGEACD